MKSIRGAFLIIAIVSGLMLATGAIFATSAAEPVVPAAADIVREPQSQPQAQVEAQAQDLASGEINYEDPNMAGGSSFVTEATESCVRSTSNQQLMDGCIATRAAALAETRGSK